MVKLSVDQILLDLPSGSGISRTAGQQLVREALSLLAQRLADSPPARAGRECQINQLHLEGLTLESLKGSQGPSRLCDALYARLMEAMQ